MAKESKYLEEVKNIRKEIDKLSGNIKDKHKISEEEILEEVSGVSMFQYKDIIDQITKYANNYSKSFYNDYFKKNRERYCGEINFEIDRNIISQFDFAQDLKIIVSLSPHQINTLGRGYTDNIDKARLINNKISGLVVKIYSSYNDFSGDLDMQSFENVLYHELHHVFEIYKRFFSEANGNQKEPTNVFLNKCYYELRKNELDHIFGSVQNKLKEYAQLLTYRAFNVLEINAEVCGAYGELRNVNIQQYNELDNEEKQKFIQDIIRRTNAYAEYKFLADNIEWFFNNLTNNQINAWKQIYINRGIKFGNYSFRTWLYSFSIRQLKKYLRQIGHAVSLYISQQSDFQTNNKIGFLF